MTINATSRFLCGFCLWVWASGFVFSTQALPKEPAQKKTKVHTRFDAAKNQTTAVIGPFELWKPPHNSVSGDINYEQLSLSVAFSYPGKKIVTPKTVYLAVYSSSHGRELFKKDRELVIDHDSQQLTLGEMKLTDSYSQHVPIRVSPPMTGALLFYERLTKELSFEQFSLIANSRQAKVKLGGRKYDLNKDHLEAFRNFVLLMRQENLEF